MESKPSVKNFIIAAAAMSIVIWQFMFNLGAFKTIFFDNVFSVWIVSLALLLACLWLPKNDRPVTKLQLWALFLPSLWVVVAVLSQFTGGEFFGWAVFGVGTLVMLVGLPYVALVILTVTQKEAVLLERRLKLGLFIISFIVGILGYIFGSTHYLLITCDDFKLSGSHVPENCWDPR